MILEWWYNDACEDIDKILWRSCEGLSRNCVWGCMRSWWLCEDDVKMWHYCDTAIVYNCIAIVAFRYMYNHIIIMYISCIGYV